MIPRIREYFLLGHGAGVGAAQKKTRFGTVRHPFRKRALLERPYSVVSRGEALKCSDWRHISSASVLGSDLSICFISRRACFRAFHCGCAPPDKPYLC